MTDPIQVSGFIHHVTKVEIMVLEGPYNQQHGRDIKFHCGADMQPFSFCIFGNNIEWIIPDDVFEAELRRRGELAAAKIHRGKQA